MMNWRVIVMGIYFRGPMRIWCPTKDGQERGLARATKTAGIYTEDIVVCRLQTADIIIEYRTQPHVACQTTVSSGRCIYQPQMLVGVLDKRRSALERKFFEPCWRLLIVTRN
jgi:hypothetical protein